MTFIAFSVGPKRAEIITDTSAATPVYEISHVSKAIVIPHLDAAVIAQGDLLFLNYAMAAALEKASTVATYDEFVTDASWWLRVMYDAAAERLGDRLDDLDSSVVFLVGWSHEKGRFSATGYATDDNLEPFDVESFVHPSPWTIRPSRLEMDRLRRHQVINQSPEVSEAFERWLTRPEFVAPTTRSGWVQLGIAAREQRCFSSFCTVLVAGRLVHTVLRRDSSETRVVHRFDDEADIDKIATNTFHPSFQASDCDVHPGSRIIDCCFVPFLEKPCPCGRQDRTFAECHAISAGA